MVYSAVTSPPQVIPWAGCFSFVQGLLLWILKLWAWRQLIPFTRPLSCAINESGLVCFRWRCMHSHITTTTNCCNLIVIIRLCCKMLYESEAMLLINYYSFRYMWTVRQNNWYWLLINPLRLFTNSSGNFSSKFKTF